MSTKRILLVEDDADHEALTRRAFEKGQIDAEVVVARDGEQALDYLFGTGHYAMTGPAPTPSVILLDLRLPRLSGLDVLRRLRAEERTRNVPVIILTVSTEQTDITHTYHLGANGYITKSLELDNFTETLGRISRYWLERDGASADLSQTATR